jgi:hypothetical protein
MKEADRVKRNHDYLLQLYPTFRTRVVNVISTLESQGIRPRIQEAWRSPADQLRAFNSGHSKLKFGFHNVTSKNGDPEALAVDMLDDDHPLNVSTSYLLRLAAAAQGAGLITGIRWGVPNKLVGGIDAAIVAQNWSAPVKVGWDPTHVQPVDVTVAEAKAGKRPA